MLYRTRRSVSLLHENRKLCIALWSYWILLPFLIFLLFVCLYWAGLQPKQASFVLCQAMEVFFKYILILAWIITDVQCSKFTGFFVCICIPVFLWTQIFEQIFLFHNFRNILMLLACSNKLYLPPKSWPLHWAH